MTVITLSTPPYTHRCSSSATHRRVRQLLVVHDVRAARVLFCC
jgi:hypothetical protein